LETENFCNVEKSNGDLYLGIAILDTELL